MSHIFVRGAVVIIHGLQFAYAHVYLDGDPVGLLLVFPSAIAEVCNLFKVPAHLKDQSSVLAALLPWSLTVKGAECDASSVSVVESAEVCSARTPRG